VNSPIRRRDGLLPEDAGYIETHLSDKALRALDLTDGMTGQLRACVHEFGSQIVSSLVQEGITRADKIRRIVHCCWMGAREPHQRHGLRMRGSPVADQLDWLLEQQGAKITAATLLRVLASHNMVILPREPGLNMVEASMETVSGHDATMTKYQKHLLRLRAAIDTAARKMWPQIYEEHHP
jgi:hypothetical protein